MSQCLININSVGVSGSLLDQITATSGDILSGKVIIGKDGELLTGTMPNRGAWNSSVSVNGSVTIPAGYHNGSGRVTNSTATMGGQTITPRSTSQTVSCSGRYMTGNIVVNGDSNLVAANIVSGKSIFGVAGNAMKYGAAYLWYTVPNNTGTFRYSGDNGQDTLPYIVFTGFGFNPATLTAAGLRMLNGDPEENRPVTGFVENYQVDGHWDYIPNRLSAVFKYSNLQIPVSIRNRQYNVYVAGYY